MPFNTQNTVPVWCLSAHGAIITQYRNCVIIMKRSVLFMALEAGVSDFRVQTSKSLLDALFQGQGKRMADRGLNSLL